LTSCDKGRILKIERGFFEINEEINELEGDADLILVGLWEQQIIGSLPWWCRVQIRVKKSTHLDKNQRCNREKEKHLLPPTPPRKELTLCS
jgi:hypothetical protein